MELAYRVWAAGVRSGREGRGYTYLPVHADVMEGGACRAPWGERVCKGYDAGRLCVGDLAAVTAGLPDGRDDDDDD